MRERDGWLYHGGGQALYDEIYERFGLKPFNTGDSGPQLLGWFRNEIGSIDDFRGLRFRNRRPRRRDVPARRRLW